MRFPSKWMKGGAAVLLLAPSLLGCSHPQRIPRCSDCGSAPSPKELQKLTSQGSRATNQDAELTGVVFDEQGNPAKGIAVHLSRQDAPGDFTTTTNDAGIYFFSGLKGGEYVLSVLHKGTRGLKRDLLLRATHRFISDFDLSFFPEGQRSVGAAKP